LEPLWRSEVLQTLAFENFPSDTWPFSSSELRFRTRIEGERWIVKREQHCSKLKRVGNENRRPISLRFREPGVVHFEQHGAEFRSLGNTVRTVHLSPWIPLILQTKVTLIATGDQMLQNPPV